MEIAKKTASIFTMEVVDQKQSANPNYVGNNGRPPPQDLPPKDEEEEATPPSSDNFSGTVERILTVAEPRESSPPFLAAEISSLSVLCSVQSSRKGLADDLGFADVDPDMTGQLVEYLVKHVAVASSIEVNKEAYSVIRKIKSQEVAFTIDQVSHHQSWRKKIQIINSSARGNTTHNTHPTTRNSYSMPSLPSLAI